MPSQHLGSDSPKCLTLPAAIGSLTAPTNVLDRDVGIDPMLVEKVNDLDAETLQRGVANVVNTRSQAVHTRHVSVHDVEAELRGDHHLSRIGRNASPTIPSSV